MSNKVAPAPEELPSVNASGSMPSDDATPVSRMIFSEHVQDVYLLSCVLISHFQGGIPTGIDIYLIHARPRLVGANVYAKSLHHVCLRSVGVFCAFLSPNSLDAPLLKKTPQKQQHAPASPPSPSFFRLRLLLLLPSHITTRYLL